MITVILNILFSSSMFIITKYAVAMGKPVFLVGLRASLAGLLLGSWGWYVKQKKQESISKSVWILIGVMAVFGVCLKSMLVFWGMQYTTSAKASFIFNLTPFISALVSSFIFQEKITRKKLSGLLLGLTGFVYLLYKSSDLQDLPISNALSWISWGELAIFGSVLANVIALTSLRMLRTKHTINTALFNGLSMILGGLCVIPFLGSGPYIKTTNVWGFALMFLLLIINLIAILQLKAYNLKRFRVTFMTFVFSFMPLCVAGFEYLLFARIPSLYFFQAYGIVFLGLFLFYQEELKQGFIK